MAYDQHTLYKMFFGLWNLVIFFCNEGADVVIIQQFSHLTVESRPFEAQNLLVLSLLMIN